MPRLKLYLLFPWTILTFLACQDKSEGCLNPNAVNLDVSADVNANCMFPTLALQISHRWIQGSNEGDTLNFRLDEKYLAHAGDSVTVRQFRFYVSNIALGDNDPLTVFDTVLDMDANFIKDDLTILHPSSFQFTSGHVDNFGIFEHFRMRMGFDEHWNRVDTNVLRVMETNHPWFDTELRTDFSTRMEGLLSYDVYTSNGDSTRVSLHFSDMPRVNVIDEKTMNLIQAENATVPLVIDYATLLADKTDRVDTSMLKNEIWRDLAQALVVLEGL